MFIQVSSSTGSHSTTSTRLPLPPTINTCPSASRRRPECKWAKNLLVEGVICLGLTAASSQHITVSERGLERGSKLYTKRKEIVSCEKTAGKKFFEEGCAPPCLSAVPSTELPGQSPTHLKRVVPGGRSLATTSAFIRTSSELSVPLKLLYECATCLNDAILSPELDAV
jgi:hypothetical protein